MKNKNSDHKSITQLRVIDRSGVLCKDPINSIYSKNMRQFPPMESNKAEIYCGRAASVLEYRNT